MNEVKSKSSKIRSEEKKDSVLASEKQSNKKKNGVIVGLAIATGVLSLSTIGFGIAFGIADGYAMKYQTDLENVYNENFYSLLDSVNNLETKLSKTLSASGSYQRKLLLEASQNASEAEVSISQLPLSQGDIQDTIKLVNQISGYTSTLADELVEGGTLSNEEIATLENVYQSVLQLKQQLNDFAKRLDNGYSILDGSLDVDSNANDFTRSLSLLKNNDIEYPTMIYDGPFSDSVVNSEVKGLSGSEVDKTQAGENVLKFFKNSATLDYEGETKGRFETFNYRVTSSDNEMLYVQVSKIGGHILTISGAGRDGRASIDMEGAKDIAVKFATDNGIENAEVVWSDSIKNDVYLNIAPKVNGIILYPDLVKVKVNMVSGTIVGYDATPYFTNHISRSLSKGTLTLSDAKGKVPSDFEIVNARVVLSPLDYNREVVCVEVEADKGSNTYYFYYNVENGDLENVLKVIQTEDGNLLM